VHDLDRGTFGPLTREAGVDRFPLWTPDGDDIVFTSSRDGGPINLYRRSADGTGPVTRLATSDSAQFPYSWSPNGQDLVFVEQTPGADATLNIQLLPMRRNAVLDDQGLRIGAAPAAPAWRPDMALRPGFHTVFLAVLFVLAVVVDGLVLAFVEPAGSRLLYGLLLLLPIMWPVVWLTGHFGLMAKVTETVMDPARRRQFFRLRALTVQFIEEVKRLNWLAFDAKREVRRDDDVSEELGAIKRRLHDLVDQMPAAAGFSELPADDVAGE